MRDYESQEHIILKTEKNYSLWKVQDFWDFNGYSGKTNKLM